MHNLGLPAQEAELGAQAPAGGAEALDWADGLFCLVFTGQDR